MRMMLKVSIPVEGGNQAARDGTLATVTQTTVEALKPEATYHAVSEGERTSFFFFDLTDVSLIPSIAEPLFHGLGARLELVPVMTNEDLAKGIQAAMKQASPSS